MTKFHFKVTGYAIDKDGNIDFFTEKDITQITWKHKHG